MIEVRSGSIRRFEKTEWLEAFAPGIAAENDVVVSQEEGNDRPGWPRDVARPYWLVNLNTRIRRNIVASALSPVTNIYFAPDGDAIIYWCSERDGFCSYEMRTGITRTLTSRLPPVSLHADNLSSFVDNLHSQPAGDVAAWSEAWKAVLVYDRYDIWSLDVLGKREPVNITNGYGKKNHVTLRLAYERDSLGNEVMLGPDEMLLLTGFDALSKNNGFFVKRLSNRGDPEVRTMARTPTM
jgi:hypothetical protein